MTIKVEREALLRVLTREPLGFSSLCDNPSISDDGEFVLVDIPKPFMGEDCYVKSLRGFACDDQSLCTVSTDSLSDDSTASIERRVTFSTPLVTDEWTRPWTPREDIADLFYSSEETLRFRQEYRLERKVLNDLSIDPTFPAVQNGELSTLIGTCTTSSQSSFRHRISRVVVLHNERLETFLNPNEVPTPLPQPKEPESVDDFFDNDSFWSGSLTWY